MKKLACFALSLLLLCSLAGCGPAGYEELTAAALPLSDKELEDQEAAVPAVYAALSDFGLSLLQGAQGQAEEPVLVSPLSVALALSMAAGGAQGDTLAQFEAVLGGGERLETLYAACQTLTQLYENLGGSTECSIANSLWVDPEGQLREDFIGRCAGVFDAQVLQAELSDPDIVPALNSWVSRHTEDMIPEIISEPFSEDTAALLVNALYLKNTWETEFDPLVTRERDFYHADGTEAQMDFLHHYEQALPYLKAEGAQGALLPYDDGRLAFFALMPDEGEDFDAWLSGLDGAELARLIRDSRDRSDLFLRLSLPKFEAEWSGELAGVLSALGLDLAFDPERADFSALGDSPAGYFLSRVFHATRIEVNEEGTEAAAATAVAADAGDDAPPPEGIELDFDRPSLYGIVDTENGVPLFLGTFL